MPASTGQIRQFGHIVLMQVGGVMTNHPVPPCHNPVTHLDDPVCPPISTEVDFYRISLLGCLPDDLFDIFSPMLVKAIHGHTVLLGPVEDQAALQGLLTRIQSLGLELEEVKRVRSARGNARHIPIKRPY